MKQTSFIIFVLIVLTVYILVNTYILIRGSQALPKIGPYRMIFWTVMVFLILSYPAARILERSQLKGIAEGLLYIGAYYLAVMVFAFFLILMIDILRLGNHFFHYFPKSWQVSGNKIGWITFLCGTVLVLSLTVFGVWNSRNLRIRNINITMDKSPRSLNRLIIVLASDIHLGTIIHNSRLREIVNQINALKPDLILLAGDVFDEDITSLIEQNMAALLSGLKSQYGVFAVPGNHEYIGGIENAVNYLNQAGVTVLPDSVANVANSFYIVGRNDRSASYFGGKRKPLSELMQQVDKEYPIILMDHQPFSLQDARKNNVDLQVSGHTHHGQIIPFNLITMAMYELSWGYLRKGNTHYCVSCGVGTWGPPVRIGNRPELVTIDVQFEKNLQD